MQVWSALQINFNTLLKPDCQSCERNSSMCTSLPFPLVTNDGSRYITWLGLMLWLTTSNRYSAPRLLWHCETDMVQIECSRWWGNSQQWSWVVHSERVCIHCHPGFSWRLNQAGHSLQMILQKQTLEGPCLLRPMQLPLCLTPLTCFLQFKCTFSAASISKSSCVFSWGVSLEKDYLFSRVRYMCHQSEVGFTC